MSEIWYVDIPTERCVGDPDGAWRALGTFRTKEEAVEFIREELGDCDDDGNICLLTRGDDGKHQ